LKQKATWPRHFLICLGRQIPLLGRMHLWLYSLRRHSHSGNKACSLSSQAQSLFRLYSKHACTGTNAGELTIRKHSTAIQAVDQSLSALAIARNAQTAWLWLALNLMRHCASLGRSIFTQLRWSHFERLARPLQGLSLAEPHLMEAWPPKVPFHLHWKGMEFCGSSFQSLLPPRTGNRFRNRIKKGPVSCKQIPIVPSQRAEALLSAGIRQPASNRGEVGLPLLILDRGACWNLMIARWKKPRLRSKENWLALGHRFQSPEFACGKLAMRFESFTLRSLLPFHAANPLSFLCSRPSHHLQHMHCMWVQQQLQTQFVSLLSCENAFRRRRLSGKHCTGLQWPRITNMIGNSSSN